MISDATGIPKSNIILSVSHTHSSLLSNLFGTPNEILKKEISNIQKGAIESVKLAKSNMQKASISYIHSTANLNTNNGEINNNDEGYDLLGISDKSLDIIKITNDLGANIALLLNYSSHAEVMFKSITKDGMSEISGDLPGQTAKYLENAKNGAPVVLFTSGAEGDQLPLFKSVQTSAQLGTIDEGIGGWALLDVQARRLATIVLDSLKIEHKIEKKVGITSESSLISITGQKIDMNRNTGEITIKGTDNVNMPITVIKIGDIAFVGLGGDIASSIGINIKKNSPLEKTILITNMAGNIGYILDDKAYINPGHGAMGSPIKPGFAEKNITEKIN